MFIYQLLIRLLSPLIWLITFIEAIKRKGGWRYVFQRFGASYPSIGKDPIWIHCASVGEVKAAEPLIQRLIPNKNILITTNTPTGATLVNQLFEQQVTHVYCPLDWPYAIKRFLKHLKPHELWVVETEIWPNLFSVAAQKHLTISMINARLSKKTLSSPQWLQSAYKQSLQKVSRILARSEDEATRFIQLGATPDKIQVLGNLKYAALMNLPDYPNPVGREYVLLASSHKSEERAVTELWLTMKRPELLVIVPRHPKRINEILDDLKPYRGHTAVFSLKESITKETKIFIDDQIGALMSLYAHAKIVIMGGSFVAKGGHNILEPAAVRAAIITGFDMSDFESETQLLKQHQALIQTQNYRELKDALGGLIDDKDKQTQMGSKAHRVVLSQTHLLENYLIALNQK